MKRKLWWRLAGIGVLTLLLFANIIPWRQLGDGFQWSDLLDTLRPGIDLAGGNRLIYQVNTESWHGAAGESPAQSMIRALKTRVDPANSLNLQWRPVGDDRIEIIVPRATVSSSRQREAYAKAREKLLATDVTIADIAQARERGQPSERRQAFLDLVRGVQDRRPLLEKLASAYEEQLAAERAQKAASQPEQLAETVRLARDRHDAARRDVLATNVSLVDVDHVLRIGQKLRTKKAQADDPKSQSPLESLLARYKDRAGLIKELVDAHDAWKKEKQALDDPNDLKRVLQGTGELEFHIAVRRQDEFIEGEMPRFLEALDRGQLDVPEAAGRPGVRWYEAASSEVAEKSRVVSGERFGTPFVLAYTAPEQSMVHTAQQDWKFNRAYVDRDEWGLPSIGFTFDDTGGQRFSVLTQANLERPLAAIVDGKVISVATIQSRISTSGRITGSFSPEQAVELAQKLQAGALPGSLSKEPISESVIGPQLGMAHRSAGFRAALIAVSAVAVFMILYYLIPLGLVAIVAVVLDLIYILGFMAKGSVLPWNGFTFTLPGIAGLALTIGMAVDANVLIDERIREEQDGGAPLRTAIKNGYAKALSAILDSNVTTLITTVILYFVGTAEIKGFAVVLGIGVAASMFTSVVVTRVLLQLGVEHNWIKSRMKMMRLIRVPRIRWMDKRYLFWGVSLVLIVLGLAAFIGRPAKDLYDVEFAGGTKGQFTLAPGAKPTDAQIEDLLRSRGLKDATVHTVLKQGEGVGDRAVFEVLTGETDQATVVKPVLIDALQNPKNVAGLGHSSLLPERAVLDFRDKEAWGKLADERELNNLPAGVHRITARFMEDADLSKQDLGDYTRGVAIVIDGLQPAASLEELATRIRGRLESPQFVTIRSAAWTLFPIDSVGPGGKAHTKVVYVARSENESLLAPVDAQAAASEWQNKFVLPQIQLVHQALSAADVLDSLNTYSPSVARDVKLQALAAIILSLIAVVIYVWVRFGNVLFGLGAILPLFHDVAVTVGFVAISAKIVQYMPGLAGALMIQDFRFDLTVVAALLTIIGYSLNDTIVVFDRIRENRGRLPYVTTKICDDSINQTMSRTLLTVLTTMVAVFIMYVYGGQGIHAFCYTMLVGLCVGTYSSIAIGSPLLLGWRGLMRRAAGAGGAQSKAAGS